MDKQIIKSVMGGQPAEWSNATAETDLPGSFDQDGDAQVPAAGEDTAT